MAMVAQVRLFWWPYDAPSPASVQAHSWQFSAAEKSQRPTGQTAGEPARTVRTDVRPPPQHHTHRTAGILAPANPPATPIPHTPRTAGILAPAIPVARLIRRLAAQPPQAPQHDLQIQPQAHFACVAQICGQSLLMRGL